MAKYNGQIGCGWYPSDDTYYGTIDEMAPIRSLAEDLLKGKLSNIFGIFSEKNRERLNASKKIKKQESV